MGENLKGLNMLSFANLGNTVFHYVQTRTDYPTSDQVKQLHSIEFGDDGRTYIVATDLWDRDFTLQYDADQNFLSV